MPNPIIQTKKLTIGYTGRRENHPVQEDLNLNVYQGELVCLVGPNGCGKSTLLRSLAGIQSSLDGEILIKDIPLSKLPLKEKAKLMALVLTDKVEVSNLSVYGLVSIGRNPYTNWLGTLNDEDQEKVNEAIRLVHLEGYENRFLNELSDGEKQRAMIAKALVQDTPVILLDEPTAHLDLPNRIEIMILLRTLAKETDKAVILSTHELDIALQASDKLWLMTPHQGVMTGGPEDMILNNNIQTTFANRSFYFDSSTGNFVMRHKGNSKAIRVKTIGNGLKTYWTQRALSRNGYILSEKALYTITVDETKGIWHIESPHKSSSAFSLYDLIKLVEEIYAS